MIGEQEARETILQQVQPLAPRSVQLTEALGCFVAKDYFARIPLPAFDNSAMDGYAVIAKESGRGKRKRVVGEQPAGVDRQLRVSAGEAIRIFTGAPIPVGADAVIMQEDVTRDGDEIISNVDVDPGAYIRTRGCDLSEGQRIVAAREKIRSVSAALFASQGFVEVLVGGEVRAAIISTGDELVRLGETVGSGQIYDSNSVLLATLVQGSGAVLQSVEHCSDDPKSLRETVARAAKNHVVIISGGVSVGEHDYVQSVLRDLGGKIDIWRVAIKPGKPFLFGRLTKQVTPSPQSSQRSAQSRTRDGRGAPSEGSLIFGLPGNPVSAFVTFLRFVRPALLKLMGAADADLELRKVPAKLIVDLHNDSDRVHYIRGKFEHGKFADVGRQESHALFGLSQSNAMLPVPIGARFKKGSVVDVEVWD
jgi:molybdopterin molybdotransferase